jgi:hypothetical protein
LSFELYAGDKAFIVDPGAYVYMESRSGEPHLNTQYHNTVVIDATAEPPNPVDL